MDGVRCGQDGPPTCAAEREWHTTKADQKKGVPVVYNLRNSTYSPKTELSPVSREILKRRWLRSTIHHSHLRRSRRSIARRHELRERERTKQRRSGFKRSVSSVDGSLGAGKSGLKNSYTVKV